MPRTVVASTVTNTPSWVSMVTPVTPGKGVQRTPKPRSQTQQSNASAVEAKAVRSQAAAQSHNVFRPDIYRVSEGYLN